MNVKKTAASALAVAGQACNVGDLLKWLSYHDNPGFRQLLREALKAILKESYLCTVLAEISRRTKHREIVLLLASLSNELPLRALKLGLDCDTLWSRELLEEIKRGGLEFCLFSVEEVLDYSSESLESTKKV